MCRGCVRSPGNRLNVHPQRKRCVTRLIHSVKCHTATRTSDYRCSRNRREPRGLNSERRRRPRRTPPRALLPRSADLGELPAGHGRAGLEGLPGAGGAHGWHPWVALARHVRRGAQRAAHVAERATHRGTSGRAALPGLSEPPDSSWWQAAGLQPQGSDRRGPVTPVTDARVCGRPAFDKRAEENLSMCD